MGRGSIQKQAAAVFYASGLYQKGQSRHDAKEQAQAEAREELGRGLTSKELSERIGIYGSKTFSDYIDRAQDFARFAEDKFGIASPFELRAEHAAEFLLQKMQDGCLQSTLAAYGAALRKFDIALERSAEVMRDGRLFDAKQEDRIRSGVDEAAQIFNEYAERGDRHSRAYQEPEAVIGAISQDDHRLAAAIQVESGARLTGVQELPRHFLHGIVEHPVTGEEVGSFHCRGKGSFDYEAYVSLETYSNLDEYVQEHGALRIDPDAYREDVKQACEAVGEDYSGTHAFRHNFVQEMYGRAIEIYQDDHKAAKAVMELVGHHRTSVLQVYLR